jgi:hypothetical protein
MPHFFIALYHSNALPFSMAFCTRQQFFSRLDDWHGRVCLCALHTPVMEGSFVGLMATADVDSGKIFFRVDETHRLAFELKDAESFVFMDYRDVEADPLMRRDVIAGYEAVLEASIADRLLVSFALKMEG